MQAPRAAGLTPGNENRASEVFMRRFNARGKFDLAGPEPEFFIFDEVRYEQNQHTGYYQVDSVEGAWNTARFEEPNLGYKPSYKGGYFPVSPTDTYHDLRGEMVREMQKVGIVVEAQERTPKRFARPIDDV